VVINGGQGPTLWAGLTILSEEKISVRQVQMAPPKHKITIQNLPYFPLLMISVAYANIHSKYHTACVIAREGIMLNIT
jgi:hypothetical protein